MKLRKVLAVGLVMSMMASLTACDGNNNSAATDTDTNTDTNTNTNTNTSSDDSTATNTTDDGEIKSYADFKLGEDYTDVTATIKVFNNRTDMDSNKYEGVKNWDGYLADFKEMYPNINVEIVTSTNYAEDAVLHLQGGDYEDVMLIPAVDNNELDSYFMSYGDLATLENEVNFADQKAYDGKVYGIASTGDAQGIVYNKKVFEEAGIIKIERQGGSDASDTTEATEGSVSENGEATESVKETITGLPTTPEEFQKALQAIKEKTDAIPLYTNFAAGWTMEAWDAYINGTATGDATYMQQKFPHTENPFADTKDGTHAYNVYKVLYDAVSNGLTEEDFATTDWEGSKSMINEGKIGCMVLGSWAVPQMQNANKDNADDIGYMSFPITVDGKQYATCGPNYTWGINKNASTDNKKASLAFVKWMTEKSGFQYNEGGMPIAKSDTHYPTALQNLVDAGVEFVADKAALEGEENFLANLNASSELAVNSGGKDKVQEIVENASTKDKTFDEMMDEWNTKWTEAQDSEDIERLYDTAGKELK